MNGSSAEVFRTAVLMAPFADVVNLVGPFDSISKWGCSIVDSCAIENGLNPTEVDAVRASRLVSGQRVVLRERLTCTNSEACVVDSRSRCLEMAWELLPGGPSPFPCPLLGATTTLTVMPVTEEAERCFAKLSMRVTCRNETDATSNVAFASEQLLRPMIQCLSEVVIAVAYSSDPHQETQYFTEFKKFESSLLQMRVDPGLGAPARAFEELFASWVALARRERQLQGRLMAAAEDVEAAKWNVEAAREMVVEAERRAHVANEELLNVDSAREREASVQTRAEVQSRVRKLAGSKNGNGCETGPLEDIMRDPPPNAAVARSALHAGCAVTPEQLRNAFVDLIKEQERSKRRAEGLPLDSDFEEGLDEMRVDIDAALLSRDVVVQLWRSTEHFGLDADLAMRKLDDWLKKHVPSDHNGALDFTAFSLLMLHLAQL